MARIIFAISGASGMPLSMAMLRLYSAIPSLELHLIISAAARQTWLAEHGQSAMAELEKYSMRSYNCGDMAAAPASGSWPCDGMVICPCSMTSLAAIANGCGSNLLHRAADVSLKERRPLIMVVRETPYSRIHIKNMLSATDAGAVIMPFAPAFYTGRAGLEEMFRQFAGRVLDQLRIKHDLCSRWQE